MTYAAGQTILDDEYNIFVAGTAGGSPLDTYTGHSNVNALWATGDGATVGYKQSGPLAVVSPGTTVSATQWANLINRISTIANHQGTSITTITAPTAGNTIEAEAQMQTNLSTIWNNRLYAAAVGGNITSGGVGTYSSSWGGTGQNQNLDIRHVVTFASGAALDAFFNCGGRILNTMSRSGGSATNKNTAWTNACTAMGTGVWTGNSSSKTIAGTTYTGFTKVGGSGTNSVYNTAAGIQNLTVGATFSEIHTMFAATSPYTASSIQRYVRRNSETQLDIWTRFNDDANSNTDESANGTFTSTIVLSQPSTTYLSNSWGTPTISTSAVTF